MIRPSVLSGAIFVPSLGGSAVASERLTGAGAITLNQITLDQNLAGENPNLSAAGAYPIATLTWVLAYKTGNRNDAAVVKEAFNYMLSDAAQNKAPSLGFVPLKGEILSKAKAAVNKIGRQ